MQNTRINNTQPSEYAPTLLTFFSAISFDIRASILGCLFLFVPAFILFFMSFSFAGVQKVFFDYVVDRNLIGWGLILVAIAFVIVSVLSVIRYILQDQIDRTNFNIVLRIRQQYLSKLMQKPISFFEAHFAGELLNRSQDAEDFVSFWVQALSYVVERVVVVAICGLILCLISPVVAVITILPYVVLMLWSIRLSRRLRELSLHQMQEDGKLQTLIIQRMDAFTRFYVMGMQRQLFLNCLPSMTRSQAAEVELNQHIAAYQAITRVLEQGVVPVATFAGAFLIMQGELSYGDFVIASFASGLLVVKIRALADNYQELQKHNAAIPRLMEVMQHEIDYLPTESTELVNDVNTDVSEHIIIATHGLGFGFNEIDSDLFDDINLKISRGKLICITGNSGVGKTTLLEVLSAQRVPTKGYITRQSCSAEASNRYGFVFSDDSFISGNLVNFLTIGLEYDRERIKWVMSVCELEERLGFFVDPSDTMDLKEQGLSRGEIQRLCLAQALYRAEDVLFFDEAFNHVSSHLAARIISRLRSMNIAIVMTTHRADIISQCDEVYRMSDGQLHVEPINTFPN